MANIDTIDGLDRFLFVDEITSKHSDDDNTEVMSMRWYVKNMEHLIDKLDKLKTFGIDNQSEESILRTSNQSVPINFTIDVINSVIVSHTKETLQSMEEDLKFNKAHKANEVEED